MVCFLLRLRLLDDGEDRWLDVRPSASSGHPPSVATAEISIYIVNPDQEAIVQIIYLFEKKHSTKVAKSQEKELPGL